MENAVQLHDLSFVPYLSEEKILERVALLGAELSIEYKNKNPLFLIILNGSFVFASDLFRRFSGDAEVAFIKSSSYNGTQSTQSLNVSLAPSNQLNGREVIVVEDIVDSGHSLEKLLPLIREKQPKSLKIVTLLFKPNAFKGSFAVDYVGFEIPNDFIVGYGLDYNELGRNLRDIYVLRK